MREKLLDLMKHEGLKPSQLAEILEINPAGISHILAGRNKPSFELLQKILRRFPRINPDWLLLDSEQMYRNDSNGSFQSNNSSAEAKPSSGKFGNSLFENQDSSPKIDVPSEPSKIPSGAGKENLTGGIGTTNGMTGGNGISEIGIKASVERIVIFYDDQTCECYFPTKR